MAELQPTDEFLVNHDGTTYTQEQGTLMANLESDDLLLINRSDVTYTITGDELISSIIDPLEVNVSLAPLPPIVSSSVTATAFAVGGKAPDGGYVFTYEWTLADDATGTGAAVQAETSAVYNLPGDSEGKFIKCVATTTDALGTTESGDSGYVEIEITTVAPDIASVLLTEANPGGDGRFTNNEFPFLTTMGVVGEPAPTYEAKARVFGATYDVNVKSDVITEVDGDELTFNSASSLDKFNAGADVKMTDAAGNDATYQPVTSQITNITGAAPSVTLTFDSDQDLAYFRPGDVVQSSTVPYDFVWYVDGGGIPASKTGNTYRIRNNLFPTEGPNQTLQEYLNIPPGEFDESLATELWIYGHSTSDSADEVQTSSWAISLIDTTEYDVASLAGWLGVGLYEYTSFAAQSSPSPAGTDLKQIKATGYGDDNVEVVSVDVASNQMVVNGGNWGGVDQSQTWSNMISGDIEASQPAVNGFDSLKGTYTLPNYVANSTCVFTASGFNSGDEIKVRTIESNYEPGLGPSNDAYIEVNSTKYIANTGDPENPADAYTFLRTGTVGVNGEVTINFTNAAVNGGGWNYVGIRQVFVNDKLLVDPGVDLGGYNSPSQVTGPTNGATGKFSSATNNTATLTNVTGRWVANDNGKGEEFYMEPTVPQIDTSTEMYCVFDATGEVTSLSQSDPGFEPIPSKDYSVQFKSQLASGEAPDDALPDGTQIEVTVKATNTVLGIEASDEETSNAVTPEAPNPEGSAGPITEVGTTSIWSSYVVPSSGSFYGTNLPTNAFDGDPATICDDQENDGTLTFTPPSVLSYSLGVRIRFQQASVEVILTDESDVSTTVNLTGESDQKWFTVAAGSGTLKSLSITGTDDNFTWWSGLEIDGGVLIDGATKLTVASSTNLDTFTADDTVKMVDSTGAVASFVPVTSQITGVASYNYTPFISTANVSTDTKKVFDGSQVLDQIGVVYAGEWIFTTDSFGFSDGTLVWYSYNANGSSTDYTASYKFVGETAVNLAAQSGPLTTFSVTVPAGKTLEYVQQDSSSQGVRANVVNYFEWNGDRLIDGHTTLTLTDDTDLKYFKPGDQVQEAELLGTEIMGTDNPSGFNPSYPAKNAHNGDPDTFALLATYGDGYSMYFNVLYFNTNFTGEVSVYGSSETSNYNYQVEYDDGSLSPISGIVSGWKVVNPGNTTKKVVRVISKSETNTPTFWAVSLDGGATSLTELADVDIINPNPKPAVKVVGEPDLVANTMTVDGGKWDTSNQSQVWSANQTGWPIAVGYEGFGPEKAFDGDTQETNAQSDQTSTLNFSNLGTGTVGIVANGLTFTGDSHYTVNGTRLTTSNTTETTLGSRKLFTYNTPVELSTITQQGGAGALYGVYVDGKLLVDAVNDSQVWSDNTTGIWTSPATLAFDGDLNATGAYSDGSPATINFTGLDSVTKIRIYGSEDSLGTAWNIVTNEGDFNPFSLGWAQGSFNWAEIPGTELISITNNNGQGQLRAVEIDGQLLIDAGTDRGLGDTEVTGPAKSGEGVFVSTNDTDEIVLKDSNGEWIDNGDYFAKEMNAFLKAGNARDEAEYQAIADAFAAYPGKVTARQTTVSTLVAQLAATLSQADAVLLYDAVDFEQPHADQGPIAVNGYYPLYTTQAASDAIGGTSHAHTFDGTTYYMPDTGATVYHGNYSA